MKETTIDFVLGDDWSGIYLNTALQMQGHMDLADAMALLDLLEIAYNAHDADLDWLGERGTLPERFQEVQLDFD
jgi:hypothetical protein